MATKTERRVKIIARYELKGYKDIICYRVESSNGLDEYRTCYSAGRVNCDCKGFGGYGHCYHADEIRRREEERKNALLDNAYELIAAMRQAVESVPQGMQSCEYCGKNHSAANCPF